MDFDDDDDDGSSSRRRTKHHGRGAGDGGDEHAGTSAAAGSSSFAADPVQSQTIDRSDGMALPQITSSGYHMPPEVLGRRAESLDAEEEEAGNEDNEDDNKDDDANANNNNSHNQQSHHQKSSSSSSSRRRGNNNNNISATINSSAKKRWKKAIKAAKSQAASKAAAKVAAATEDETAAAADAAAALIQTNTTMSSNGSIGSANVNNIIEPTTKTSSQTKTKPNTTNTAAGSHNNISSSIFTFLSYRGMEVIFGVTTTTTQTQQHSNHQNQQKVAGVCSRTHFLFQTLDLVSESPIVSITSNSYSGMVVICHSDGIIQTYVPIPTNIICCDDDDDDDENHENHHHPVAAHKQHYHHDAYKHHQNDLSSSKSIFGRFRWINGRKINAGEVFYQPNEHVNFQDRRRNYHQKSRNNSTTTTTNKTNGQLVDISSSASETDSNQRLLLVAHRNQLAVFDASYQQQQQPPSSSANNNNDTSNGKAYNILSPSSPNITSSMNHDDANNNKNNSNGNATLLWTSILSSNIVAAKMSGDGQAIVAVLEDDNNGSNNNNNNNEYGARTFIHDMDDGSIQPPDHTQQQLQQSSSIVGMVYKPGPFLHHETAVTRISFRGMGHNTSSSMRQSIEDDGQGNDLLLTYCEDDSSVRIFNQNNWQQLMFWMTPPNSRADWIIGSSAFTLGDLESQKKPKNNNATNAAVAAGGLGSGSKAPSRRNSGTSINDASSAGGGINNNLRSMRSLGAGTPTTAAGAWIAEITFRNAFPALRLSRLSYMKRGNDDSQPAHFESVAAILPAGSISSVSVLNSDDMGLAIQGIWPAWNPWLSETTEVETDDTLRGSAMQFLGLSSLPPTTGPYFGDSYLGGTHSPPIELRIIASNPKSGSIVLMEFPLWGDEDFGAMELGSPIRSVLSLSDALALPTTSSTTRPMDRSHFPGISMEYESSRLCARIESDCRSISLLWRRPGSMSLNPHGGRSASAEGDVGTNTSLFNIPEPKVPEVWNDLSAVPVPLALPSLLLPKQTTKNDKNQETLAHISWFPDPSYGGPPLLLAVTCAGTILVFELPPLWCAREPVMPNYDPFNAASSTGGSIGDDNNMYDGAVPASFSDEAEETGRSEYSVMVTPHTDFGLGLRLESPMDGMPAVAGSFKKHPINGGMLPAERTGMIVLGDEILSVNGVLLENMTFDDIISTVRHVGAEAGPGQPLTLRFRPAAASSILSSRRNSEILHGSVDNSRTQNEIPFSDTEVKSGRVTVSSRTKNWNEQPGRSNSTEGDSLANLLVGNAGEAQQEFGRLIAIVRRCFPRAQEDEDYADRLLILPWGQGIGAADQNELRGVVLIAFAIGNEIIFKRLELPAICSPARESRCIELGNVAISNSKDGDDGVDPTSLQIVKIVAIENSGPRRCFVVADNSGLAWLVVLDIQKGSGPSIGKEENRIGSMPFNISFTQYEMFDIGPDPFIRAESPCLFAVLTQKTKGSNRKLRILTARPDSTSRKLESDGVIRDDLMGQDYQESVIEVESSKGESDVVDFCFLTTGFLDACPTFVVFLNEEVVVYQKRGPGTRWVPLLRLEYPQIPGSIILKPSVPAVDRSKFSLAANPIDSYPHLTRCIRSILPSYDESRYIVSDWHPESLLSLLCTDNRGANAALKLHIEKILFWLADNPESAGTARPETSNSQFCVVPFVSTGGKTMFDEAKDDSNKNKNDASSVMSQLHSKGPQSFLAANHRTTRMAKLTDAIDALISAESKPGLTVKSNEFQIAMSHHHETRTQESPLFSILKKLDDRELRVLKAIAALVTDPPDYRNLDAPGQLTLTIANMHRALKETSGKEKLKASPKHSPSKSNPYSHFRRLPSGASEEKSKLPPQNASAGCFAALLSDYQGLLLDCIRQPGKKLDWTTVRESRVPFWIRSDEKLRQLSEEIGQNMYRESRDILKSAIFFIIAGKKRTLTNLSAADRTESGQKFFKFLTSFDFSSDRGRSAAEKNAFSLLRKNQYESAAAFFLLAEPPGVKSAVETIASKMEDLDLAFMVARLIGNENSSASNGGFNPNSGALGGFGGMLGGGGGYAGSGAIKSSKPSKDNDKYVDWKPSLQKSAIELLRDRGLPGSRDDTCFSAAQLLWLGRHDEASHWLSGFIGSPDGLIPRFLNEVKLPTLNHVTASSKRSNDPVISLMNDFVGFVSGPLLLKMMSASSRTLMASSLLVSDCLSKRGIELAGIRPILQNIDPLNFGDTNEKRTSQQEEKKTESQAQQTSSIFASFDGPFKNKKPPQPAVASSIFDSFDVPTPQRTPAKATSSSSIFDNYDVAPTPSPAKPAIAPNNGASSSIFDNYDVAPTPSPAKTTVAPNNGASSSIFDTFDVAPTPPPSKTTIASNKGASSSIFDTYDVAPTPSPAKATVAANNGAPSSIFDAYDVAPARPPAKAAAAANNGASSSIFDAYDAPISKRQPKGPKPEDVPTASKPESSNPVPDGPIRSLPKIWFEWREHLLLWSAARRLIREVASICFRFHGEAFEPVPRAGGKGVQIPTNAAQVLQFHCDGEALIQDVQDCVRDISKSCACEEETLVIRALQLIESPYHFNRVCFAVLLRLSLKEVDEAEDIVKNTAQLLIEMCSAVSFTSHMVSCSGNCIAPPSICQISKSAAHLSWQLELCLWMHRGGALPLTGDVLNESICAVRIGLLVASWNQDYECVETMIQQPPDCLVDQEVGRQLWSSLKVISSANGGDKRHAGTSSGGWEFLVDCRRAEATELLRPRSTGCFIIRPHPDDHGVFTLSFKTNLVPSANDQSTKDKESKRTNVDNGSSKSSQKAAKTVKRDDVVQHAIVRLSDSGFRCGSFGPFATLMKLLEAVSSSLPFDLRFDRPPTEGVIKEEGSKPSPNSAFFRKLGLARSENMGLRPPLDGVSVDDVNKLEAAAEQEEGKTGHSPDVISSQDSMKKDRDDATRREKFGYFLELLILSEVRKQLSGVAAAKYDNFATIGCNDEVDSVGSVSDRSIEISAEQEFAVAARILRPLLTWCQMMEIGIVSDLAPQLKEVSPKVAFSPVTLNASETAIEISTTADSGGLHGGDAVMRRMIQPGSGVEFRTLRLGDAGESAMVVLFSKREAIGWFLDNGVEKTEEDALKRLGMMERSRVIEPIDLKVLAPKAYRKATKGEEDDDESPGNGEDANRAIRYRLVDPWEVEPLDSREAETRGASLGRHSFLAFSLSKVAAASANTFRSIGGRDVLELWATGRGGVSLTKAIATVHSPWERAAGGDLHLHDGVVSEPVPYVNSIRQHLYRNGLFRRLGLPQRFMALIQVELLDLKNLTSPGGSLSLTVYSLLRLKRRSRSNAPLTVKARTLDSVSTTPMKLGKSSGPNSGPNAPASWGTLVRFRFPLPECTAADGRSYDGDREALFKGPPSVLQVSVYEKKFMSDTFLGGADVKLDGLIAGGQLEEWVPLRTETHGINWFARMRLTLRFELMCLSNDTEEGGGSFDDELAPSVGLRRIKELSSIGGAQEDLKKSVSTPDLLSHIENMFY